LWHEAGVQSFRAKGRLLFPAGPCWIFAGTLRVGHTFDEKPAASMNDTGLAFLSIEEAGKIFRERKLSPVELTRLMLARIEQLNPKLNAYITVTAELALAQARRAEAELFAPGRRKGRDRGPLHGIPISLKDNIHTAGIPTTAGSKILRDFTPRHDAQVVVMLEAAGAILLGKTNMHEFAYGVTSNNPHYGAVRNPWDLARIPGGSTGGSAAAVAAGLCYGSIGTDTGGSIRIPASLCGIVGLKPTRGLVSDSGVIPLSPTLDCTGPLARSTRDAAILLQAIAQTQAFPSGSSLPWKFTAKPTKPRLGLPKEMFFDLLSDDIGNVFDAALRDLRKLGATLRKISIPLLNETEEDGNQIAWAEATHYHQQAGHFPGRRGEYGEDVRARLEMGTKVLATSYLQSLCVRARFIHQLLSVMDEAGVDALAVPTTPISAPLIGEETTVIAGKKHPTRALLLRNNRPANLAGVPALSVPCGFAESGLPVGLQFIGRHTGEETLLRIAHAYEHAHPQRRRPPL
jgi:aspartyl-tRNA(Asn)/glutamyl-tRNA(Gln) amidotransferase subunit A